MAKPSKDIILDAELITETPDALKLSCNGLVAWCPKSRVCQISETRFEMPEWMAMEKGFI